MSEGNSETDFLFKKSGRKRLRISFGKHSWLRIWLYGILFTVAFIIAAAFIVLKSSLGSNFLDGKIQAALLKKINKFADANVKNTHFSLDNNYHIALEMRDISIIPHNDNVVFAPLGKLRFGFATMPLLHRKIEPIQMEIENSSVLIHKEDNAQSIFAALPHDDKGRIAFDASADFIFRQIEKLVAELDKVTVHTFRFSNITVNIKDINEEQSFFVRNLQIRRLRETLNLAGNIAWQGNNIAFTASAALDKYGKARNFKIIANDVPLKLGAEDGAMPYLINGRPNGGFFRLRGMGDFHFSGENQPNGIKKLEASVGLHDAHSDISVEAHIPTQFSFAASYQQGSEQIKIESVFLGLGKLEIPASGTFGYYEPKISENENEAKDYSAANSSAAASGENSGANAESAGEPEAISNKGQYAFALKAENASSSPPDSPADALLFSADVSGRLSPSETKANFDAVVLKTKDSVVQGNGSVRFGTHKWPEIILILRSQQIEVNEAKQLWPINVARSGRKSVLTHIFGGQLRNAQMEIAIPEGFHQAGKIPPPLTEKELRIQTDIVNTRADLIGTLPPLRAANGKVSVNGTATSINIDKTIAYVEDGRQLNISDGDMSFVWIPGEPLWADVHVRIAGSVGAVGKLLACKPIDAVKKVPFDMQSAKGNLEANVALHFPLSAGNKKQEQEQKQKIYWSNDIHFQDFSLGEPYKGSLDIKNAAGRAQIDNKAVQLDGTAQLNAVPATVSVIYPLTYVEKNIANGIADNDNEKGNSDEKNAQENSVSEKDSDKNIHDNGGANGSGQPSNITENAAETDIPQKKEQVTFHFDDKLRNKLFPALNIFLKGKADVTIGEETAGKRPVSMDLSQTALQIPWLGWKKGIGIPAAAKMLLPTNSGNGFKNLDIDDFTLFGTNFQITGKIKIRNGVFVSANFDKFHLNRTDRLALSVNKIGNTYQVKFNGQSFDMRSFVKNLAGTDIVKSSLQTGKINESIALTSSIDTVQGFYNENLRNFRVIYNRNAAGVENVTVNAVSRTGILIKVQAYKQKNMEQITVATDDGGAFLRFMNYYDKIQGGRLESKLQSNGAGELVGPLHMRKFVIINEPKLASVVSSVKNKNNGLNTTYLRIDRARANLTKGNNSLAVADGVIRGPSVGATFQGILYDQSGNIAMTGTYMPAYSFNRIFADVPLLGTVLGNGRDKGLIGITFKIEGKFVSPKVMVNPISAIAPGILRSIFEFR